MCSSSQGDGIFVKLEAALNLTLLKRKQRVWMKWVVGLVDGGEGISLMRDNSIRQPYIAKVFKIMTFDSPFFWEVLVIVLFN